MRGATVVLHDLDLRIGVGEHVAILGPNGCGKSTLLQIICGILPPSAGRVVTRGRIGALLELGAGFNPEFSGHENVLINGEIMGLSRAEMERNLSSIEAFAEIGEFMERPVKEYSSGMYVRLAFSTAIHVDPEILIVDEALAVGGDLQVHDSAPDRAGVLFCQCRLRSGFESGSAGASGPGNDQQQVGSERANLFRDVGLCARSDRNHANNRRDPDHDSESCQSTAQLVRTKRS